LAGTDVFIRDEGSGLALNLREVSFQTNISEAEIIASGEAELVLEHGFDFTSDATSSPEIKMEVRRQREGDKALNVGIDMVGFNPAHLQFQGDVFEPLKQADIPLNLALRLQEIEGQTRRVEFEATKYGEGVSAALPAFGGIQDMSISGVMDILNDTLSLEAVDVLTRDVEVKGSANISGLAAQRETNKVPLGFDVELEKIHWAAQNILTRPLEVKNGMIDGTYDPESGTVVLSKAHLPIASYILKAQGALEGLIGTDRKTQPAIKLKGQFDGRLSEYELLALWPKNFILGGRNWVKTSIVAATLSDMTFDIDISDFSKLEGGLPDDAVRLDFNVSDGVVDYIRTMTPLDRANGFGQLRANGIDLSLRQ